MIQVPVQEDRATPYVSNRLEGIRRSFLRDYYERQRRRALTMRRTLILGIDRGVPGTTLEERVQNAEARPGTMFYSLCNKDSQFYDEFRTDPIVYDHHRLYAKEMRMPLDHVDPNAWMAQFAAYHIMATQFASTVNGHIGEFVFHQDLMNMIPRHLIHRWDAVEAQLPAFAHHLSQGSSFCARRCPRNCPLKNQFFHFGLQRFRRLKKPRRSRRLRASTMTNWRLINNNSRIQSHVLSNLIGRRNYINARGRVNAVVQTVFNMTQADILNLSGWTTYMIVVVTWPAPLPQLGNLWQLWSTTRAKFSIYVGCTKEEDYRTDHLRRSAESPVADALDDPHARAFLALSQRFATFQEASLLEACLIETLKADKERAVGEDLEMSYNLLNKNSEFAVLVGMDNTILESMISAVARQIPMFRFHGDMRNATVNPGFISGQYLVSEDL